MNADHNCPVYTVNRDLDEGECRDSLISSAKDMIAGMISGMVDNGTTHVGVRSKWNPESSAMHALVYAALGIVDFDVVVMFRNGIQEVAVNIDPEKV